jgi:hypothetical protein
MRKGGCRLHGRDAAAAAGSPPALGAHRRCQLPSPLCQWLLPIPGGSPAPLIIPRCHQGLPLAGGGSSSPKATPRRRWSRLLAVVVPRLVAWLVLLSLLTHLGCCHRCPARLPRPGWVFTLLSGFPAFLPCLHWHSPHFGCSFRCHFPLPVM